jgi:phosphatidylglycerophosphate synthase
MRAGRRYNVAPALTTGVVSTAAVAVVLAAWLGLGSRFALQATAVCAGFLGVIVAVAGKGHPVTRFGAGNVVTTVRAGSMALIAGLVGVVSSAELLWTVVGVVAVVAVLDGADGWLARRTGLASAFGARFDMETDAALIFVLSLLVWQHGKAGSWVLMCGLMRYLFVAAGRWWSWLARPLDATRRGRTVAVGQYVGLSAALAPAVRPDIAAVIAALTLSSLAWSFGVDVLRLWRMSEGGANLDAVPDGR